MKLWCYLLIPDEDCVFKFADRTAFDLFYNTQVKLVQKLLFNMNHID